MLSSRVELPQCKKPMLSDKMQQASKRTKQSIIDGPKIIRVEVPPTWNGISQDIAVRLRFSEEWERRSVRVGKALSPCRMP